jgi:Multidrug resistance efflux pump
VAEPDDASQVDTLLDAHPRSRARRWISIALLLLALGVAGSLLLRFLEGNTTPYYMAPIIRGDLRPQLSIKGRAYLVGEITVRAPRDALLTAVPVAPGATVAPGQALAVVDTSAFAQAIDADRLALAAAHDQLARAFVESRLAGARIARYDKVWRESNHRVPSLDEMDTARAAARSAALAVRRDRALLAAAQRRLDDDMANLQATLPRAPIAGVVVRPLVAPGSQVRAGQPLLELAPLDAPARVIVPLPPGIGTLPAGSRHRWSSPDRWRRARCHFAAYHHRPGGCAPGRVRAGARSAHSAGRRGHAQNDPAGSPPCAAGAEHGAVLRPPLLDATRTRTQQPLPARSRRHGAQRVHHRRSQRRPSHADPRRAGASGTTGDHRLARGAGRVRPETRSSDP